MLQLVEVRNTAGTLLTLTLDDVSDGLIIEDIEGLDPVPATLVSSDYAQQDGGLFQSARREKRNIIIKLGLEPDYISTSVRDLRASLYQWFMPKAEVDLRFFTEEGLTVKAVGRVESFEAPFFTKEPRVDISILCFDPDFVELTEETVTGDTVDDTDEVTVAYEGTVETGIEFTLFVDRTLSEFTIYHRGPDGIQKSMDVTVELEADDILVINTVTGTKGATLTRASVSSSVLYGIAPQATWHELQPGDNDIRIYAVGDPIPWEITYMNRHGGL